MSNIHFHQRHLPNSSPRNTFTFCMIIFWIAQSCVCQSNKKLCKSSLLQLAGLFVRSSPSVFLESIWYFYISSLHLPAICSKVDTYNDEDDIIMTMAMMVMMIMFIVMTKKNSWAACVYTKAQAIVKNL